MEIPTSAIVILVKLNFLFVTDKIGFLNKQYTVSMRTLSNSKPRFDIEKRRQINYALVAVVTNKQKTLDFDLLLTYDHR